MDRKDNTSIIDRGVNTYIIDRGANAYIIDVVGTMLINIIRSHVYVKVVHQLKTHKKNVFLLFGSIHAKMH